VPVGEKPANGAVERAVGVIEGQARTLKFALEYRIGATVPPAHPVLTWLVELAGLLLRRYHVDTEGRTAYEKLRGRKVRRPMAEFEKRIVYRPLRLHGIGAQSLGHASKMEFSSEPWAIWTR